MHWDSMTVEELTTESGALVVACGRLTELWDGGRTVRPRPSVLPSTSSIISRRQFDCRRVALLTFYDLTAAAAHSFYGGRGVMLQLL